MFGIQFHPEVSHSEHGNIMLRNFVLDVCGASKDWSMAAFLEEAVNSIRTLVGEDHVIGAVSGGVDSTVAAVLLNRYVVGGGARTRARRMRSAASHACVCARVLWVRYGAGPSVIASMRCWWTMVCCARTRQRAWWRASPRSAST
ncbi:hypothetical protein EON67_07835 [archaeon]|nr:MAG: hypothetical protein EON67_07835 [archaeon]